MPLRRIIYFIVCSIGTTGLLSAKASEKPEKTYPLHGIVIAIQTETTVHGAPVYTDPYGKTHGGGVHSRREYVYTVHTDARDYDVEGKRLSVGDQVTFRTEKNRVFIQTDDGKERRYTLVGERIATQGK